MKFDMSEAWRDAVAMMTANREVLLIVAGIFFLLPLRTDLPIAFGKDAGQHDGGAGMRIRLDALDFLYWYVAEQQDRVDRSVSADAVIGNHPASLE